MLTEKYNDNILQQEGTRGREPEQQQKQNQENWLTGNSGRRLRTGRFGVKERLKCLDNNGHVRPEIRLILNTQGRHGSQLFDHPQRKKSQHYKTNKPQDPSSLLISLDF